MRGAVNDVRDSEVIDTLFMMTLQLRSEGMLMRGGGVRRRRWWWWRRRRRSQDEEDEEEEVPI